MYAYIRVTKTVNSAIIRWFPCVLQNAGQEQMASVTALAVLTEHISIATYATCLSTVTRDIPTTVSPFGRAPTTRFTTSTKINAWKNLARAEDEDNM